MKPENDKKLCEDFPKIFIQINLPMTETCMCWDFECGDGWYGLLHDLCTKIQEHCDKTDCPQVEAVQVKEKFGGLRFYIIGGDDTVDAMIREAEEAADRTCEACGSVGEDVMPRSRRGWFSVKCEDCYRE